MSEQLSASGCPKGYTMIDGECVLDPTPDPPRPAPCPEGYVRNEEGECVPEEDED